MGYRVQIRAGAHSWTIDEGDAPEFGPLAGLLIGWEADLDYMVDDSGPRWAIVEGEEDPVIVGGENYEGGFPSQLKPWRARFGIITETAVEVGDLAVDDPVWIRYRHTTAGPVAVEFTGRIREATQTPHERGAVTWLTCGDYTLDAAQVEFAPVAMEAWPLADPLTLAADLDDRLALVHDDTFPTQPVWTHDKSLAVASPDFPNSVYNVLRALFGAAGNLFTYTTDPGTGEFVGFVGVGFVDGTIDPPLRLDDDGNVSGGIDACAVPREDIEWRQSANGGSPVFGTARPGWDIATITYRSPDPEVMAGWFTLPDAMSHVVAVSDIEERWHPEGRTYWGGRVTAAEFRIGAYGLREAELTLTRKVPDPGLSWPVSADSDLIAPRAPDTVGLGTAALAAWWDASDPAMRTLDGSGNFSALTDKSGRGNDLTQAAANKRPAQGSIGGRVALSGDGFDDFLGGPTIATITPPFTVWMVGDYEAGTVVVGHSRATIRGNVDGTWRIDATAGAVVGDQSAAGADVLIVEFNGGGADRVWINGILQAGPFNSGGPFINKTMLLGNAVGGGDENAQALIGESGIHGGVLTDTERDGLHQYLANRWGTPGANGRTITWDELPVGLIWDDLPAGLTWDDLYLIGA